MGVSGEIDFPSPPRDGCRDRRRSLARIMDGMEEGFYISYATDIVTALNKACALQKEMKMQTDKNALTID
jgi:hypothetical protein